MISQTSKKRLRWIGTFSVLGITILAFAISAFVRSHPLIFSESFAGHQHCMKQATLELLAYAANNEGRLPSHTNGYADAVMSINFVFPAAFTGPGYSIAPVQAAWEAKRDIPESELGRVYVQGLNLTNDPQIVILFDKLPTPGGDHCHGIARLNARLGREVGFLDGSMEFIPEQDWPVFSTQQIKRLIAAGISERKAEFYYSEQPKPDLAAIVNKYSKK